MSWHIWKHVLRYLSEVSEPKVGQCIMGHPGTDAIPDWCPKNGLINVWAIWILLSHLTFYISKGLFCKVLNKQTNSKKNSGLKAKIIVIVLDSSLVFQKVFCHCPNTDIFFQWKGWPRCHQRPISQWRVQLQPKWDIIPSCSLWFAAIHVLNSNDSWEFLVHDYYDENNLMMIMMRRIMVMIIIIVIKSWALAPGDGLSVTQSVQVGKNGA